MAATLGETTVRVRYAETDTMGVVYYGNYLVYFEVIKPLSGGHGAYELLRRLGLADSLQRRTVEVADPVLVPFALLGAACAAGLLLCLWWKPRPASQTWLLVAFVSTTASVSLGALSGVPGERYSILPGFILLCMVLHVAAPELGTPNAWARGCWGRA